jgi:hypothetical protein
MVAARKPRCRGEESGKHIPPSSKPDHASGSDIPGRTRYMLRHQHPFG